METLNLIQGSPEWAAARTRYFCASEAAAMMGTCPNVTRDQLLHMKATLSDREFSDWVQTNILDKGHEVEAAARPIAEGILGQDLYPTTGVINVDGIPLLASFDGLTMAEETVWENKQPNAVLLEYMRQHGEPPESHWPQLEQQLLVSGADSALFTVSDGTEEGTVFVRYTSNPERRARLIAGWKQFAKDLAAYQPVQDPPKPEGRAPDALPALHIEVTGMVTASNLTAFREHAIAVFGRIKTDLQTDADFADAEKTVKWCGEVEERLEAAKQHALSQTASIDELFRTIDAIKAEARTKRLELDRLVKARKEAIRTDLVMGAQRALQEHLSAANAGLGKPYLSAPAADFALAIKGLKTISSLRNGINTALASAKIVIDQAAEKVRANLAILQELAPEHGFLFADSGALVLKAPDDLTAIVKSRLAEHAAAEEKRLEEQRERIRQEESARLENTSAPKPEVPTVSTPAPDRSSLIAVSHVTPKPASDGKTVKLGEISTMLGFTLTADFLASLGFHPHSTERAAKLYLESSVPLICEALIRHIRGVHAQWETKAAA